MRNPMPFFQGLANYVRMASDAYFWQSLGVTLFFTAVCLVVETAFGVLISLLINREFHLRGVARSIILIPMMLTPAVIALMWRVLFNPQFGIINFFIESTGLYTAS